MSAFETEYELVNFWSKNNQGNIMSLVVWGLFGTCCPALKSVQFAPLRNISSCERLYDH